MQAPAIRLVLVDANSDQEILDIGDDVNIVRSALAFQPI
jgi:hypothetical protein